MFCRSGTLVKVAELLCVYTIVDDVNFLFGDKGVEPHNLLLGELADCDDALRGPHC